MVFLGLFEASGVKGAISAEVRRWPAYRTTATHGNQDSRPQNLWRQALSHRSAVPLISGARVKSDVQF